MWKYKDRFAFSIISLHWPNGSRIQGHNRNSIDLVLWIFWPWHQKILIHWSLVTVYGVAELDHHWFRTFVLIYDVLISYDDTWQTDGKPRLVVISHSCWVWPIPGGVQCHRNTDVYNYVLVSDRCIHNSRDSSGFVVYGNWQCYKENYVIKKQGCIDPAI